MAAIYRNGIQYSAGATATFDAVPAEGSPNPITSGAIFEYMSSFQDKLTFDESPTANSTNPVTSEGIKAAIDAKKGSVEGYYYDNKFYVESTHETEITGQTEQIYVDLVTNKTYRYGGSGIGFVELSAALEFDSTPTAGSTNPVTSAGIKTAIDTKNDQITISLDENALTDASTVLSASTGENPTAMASNALSKFWTYISGKITGAISGLLTTDLTQSKALTSDANGKVTASDITATELSYLDDAKGNVQSQIDGSMELTRASVGWSGKNLIGWPKVFQDTGTTTITEYGVTCTIRSDGSILANGTVTEGGNIALKWAIHEFHPSIYGKRITINGGAEHINIAVNVSYTDGTESGWIGTRSDYPHYLTISKPISSMTALLPVVNGDVITNEVVYPMVYDASILDDTYEPYHAPVVDTIQQGVLKDAIGWSGKNLLNAKYYDTSSNGITIKSNSNGTFTVNGSLTDTTQRVVAWKRSDSANLQLEDGQYIISLKSSANDTNALLGFNFTDSLGNEVVYDQCQSGKEKTFTWSNSLYNDIYTYFSIPAETTKTFNNELFYPMIRRADITDPTYEPYHAPVQSISDNIAPTEGATASGAYTAGSYIIWQDGNMYQVTADVSQGTTWAVGTNLSKVSVGSELHGLNGRITYGTSDMTPGTTPLADGSLYFQYE